jgi:thioredoxin:protein disulfide reductase
MKSLSLIALLLVGFAGVASSKPWWMRGVDSNESDFLPPDVAFRAQAAADGGRVRVRWVIADGYYLYRSRMSMQAESPDLLLGAITLPPGKIKADPYLGSQEIYQQQVEASAGYSRFDGGAHPLEIKVTYQGCAEAGLCYPPITKVLRPAEAFVEAPPPTGHSWQIVAIIGGGFAFLLAGLLLRKGRKLDLPAA